MAMYLDLCEFCETEVDTLIILQKSYAPGSAERHALAATIAQMEQELPFEVPCIVNSLEVCDLHSYINPHPAN